jgi:hypothetical protein
VLARSPACQIKGSQGALSSLVAGCHISKEGGRVVVVGGVKLGLSQPHCLAAHLESERERKRAGRLHLTKPLLLVPIVQTCPAIMNVTNDFEVAAKHK